MRRGLQAKGQNDVGLALGAGYAAKMDYEISEIAVGGGTIGMGRMPGRGGHYARDWSTLVGWGPDVVLTLTELHELDRCGASQLGSELEDAGIGWVHLPVVDYGTPEDGDWLAIEAQLLDVLSKQRRIFVHCFGGCGRTGMAVLRLMVSLGAEPNAALKRLREVRPCAVETDAQFDWVVMKNA